MGRSKIKGETSNLLNEAWSHMWDTDTALCYKNVWFFYWRMLYVWNIMERDGFGFVWWNLMITLMNMSDLVEPLLQKECWDYLWVLDTRSLDRASNSLINSSILKQMIHCCCMFSGIIIVYYVHLSLIINLWRLR